MAPFRQFAKRRPKLLMLAALFVLTFQSLGVTLDWCLHEGEVAHLESGVAPCPDAVPDCHGDDHGSSLMFSALQSSVVAAAIAPSTEWSAVPLHYVRRDESFHSSAAPSSLAPDGLDPPDIGPPRISNAVLGVSARLLI
jgi:hypothetical protein